MIKYDAPNRIMLTMIVSPDDKGQPLLLIEHIASLPRNHSKRYPNQWIFSKDGWRYHVDVLILWAGYKEDLAVAKRLTTDLLLALLNEGLIKETIDFETEKVTKESVFMDNLQGLNPYYSFHFGRGIPIKTERV